MLDDALGRPRSRHEGIHDERSDPEDVKCRRGPEKDSRSRDVRVHFSSSGVALSGFLKRHGLRALRASVGGWVGLRPELRFKIENIVEVRSRVARRLLEVAGGDHVVDDITDIGR